MWQLLISFCMLLLAGCGSAGSSPSGSVTPPVNTGSSSSGSVPTTANTGNSASGSVPTMANTEPSAAVRPTEYNPLKYVALGDSITAYDPSYADIVNAEKKFASFIKSGIGGCTVMPTAGHAEFYTQTAAIPADTDIITLLIGVNDHIFNNPVGDINAVLTKAWGTLDRTMSFAEAFRFNLETIKRAHGNARIYVILPLQSEYGGMSPLQQYQDAEIAIADALSIPYFSAHKESGLWPGEALYSDLLHPNSAGHVLLGQYVSTKIDEDFRREETD